MFWKKDFWTDQRNELYGLFSFAAPDFVPMWRDKQILTDSDFKDIQKGMNQIVEVQNLILDHLNLVYLPETEKKEPAKLVEKKKVMTLQEMYQGVTISCSGDSFGIGANTAEKPKKKKRGRPKKK